MNTTWGIILLMIGIGCWILTRWTDRETNQPFDPIRWKQVPLRWKMLRSLKKSKPLVGLTSDGVYELLGTPDEVDGRFVDFYAHSEKAGYKHLAYRLDDDEKCDYLVLHVRESGCVVEISDVLGW